MPVMESTRRGEIKSSFDLVPLTVRLTAQWRRDGEIARAVVSCLQGHKFVPEGEVWVAVRNGWVTLKGHVQWNCQREAAAMIARGPIGVRGVINSITVAPYPPV